MMDPRSERPWKTHAEEPRLLVRGAGRRRGRLLPRPLGRADPQLRRRDDQGRASARGARPEPELPDGVGRRGRAVRSGPLPDLGARDPGDRAGDRRPAEHHGAHRLPHLQRRPPAAVLELRRRPLPDARPADVPAPRREGDGAHRLPGGLDLPRLQVRPEADGQGRRQRLALRPPRPTRGRPSSGARSARRVSRTSTTSTGCASIRPRTI